MHGSWPVGVELGAKWCKRQNGGGWFVGSWIASGVNVDALSISRDLYRCVCLTLEVEERSRIR